MVGSRGSAPTGRFTYTTYMLPTGTLTIVYPLNLIRTGCGTRFRGMRSLTFAACGKKNVIFYHFHNLPLSQKLDPRLKSMDVPLPCTAGVAQDDAESSDKTPCTNTDLKAAESLYDELMAMAKDAEEVANDEAIARIQAIRDAHLETLAKDPTASLWIQYLNMIRILRKFIRVEWLGN